MNDIFISYTSSDRERIIPLVHALENSGFTVWWDRTILPGNVFDEVIEEALTNTKCVIAIWSKESVDSDWVKVEADEGADRDILIPVLIDDVKIPLEFRRIQAASLINWNGDITNIQYKNLIQSVSLLVGKDVEKNISKDEVTITENNDFSVPKEIAPDIDNGNETPPQPKNIQPTRKNKFPVTYPIIGALILVIFAFVFLEGFEEPKSENDEEITKQNISTESSNNKKSDSISKDTPVSEEPVKTEPAKTTTKPIDKKIPSVISKTDNNTTFIGTDTKSETLNKDNSLKEIASAKRNPQGFIKIINFSFFAPFNGVAQITNLKIENTGPVSYKNIKIRVNLYAGGNLAVTQTKVLPITLPANSKETYLKDGIVLDGGSTDMTAKIEVLGATTN